MSENHPNLDEDLSRLRAYNIKLNSLVSEMLKEVKIDEQKDHLGFMALAFVNKQMEHLKSVCLLVNAGQHRDASVISRIMMEGLAQLYWANKEPTERPLNWRAYSWVEQFRRSYGRPTYTEHKAEIESQLKAYCTQYGVHP